jgi:hypothetical protein
MKLTLDWNCVIEVEEGRSQASCVTNLVNAHRIGEFEVALLAASASENTKSKLFPGNAGVFKRRVAQLGWDDLPLVPMPGIIGLSYWGFSFYVGDGEVFKRDMDALWQIIAPKLQRKPLDHLIDGQALEDNWMQSEALSKWRNAWCDVVSAYSHIHAARDIFVTNNTRDFQKNAPALALLGMKNISTPVKTRDLIEKLKKCGLVKDG